jgi:hypothetical protein
LRLDEPIRGALEAQGIPTEDSRLFDQPDSMYVGPRFRICTCEMVFSIPEPGLMLLNLFRRLAPPTGALNHPFADLLWFLLLVTEPRFGLHRIMGYVDTSEYAAEGGLNDHRLRLFYERFFQARQTRYDRSTWFYRDVDPSLRALLERSAHKATRISRRDGRVVGVRRTRVPDRATNTGPASVIGSGLGTGRLCETRRGSASRSRKL